MRPDRLVDLAGALAAVDHPGAVYWSILARRRGGAIPAPLQLEALCDAYLLEQIEKFYRPDAGGDLFTFEYWWRKARPKIRRDPASGTFTLTSRTINIH